MAVVSKEEQAKRRIGFRVGIAQLLIAVPVLGDFMAVGMFFKHTGMILARSAQRMSDLFRLFLYVAVFFMSWGVLALSVDSLHLPGIVGFLFVFAPFRIFVASKWFSDIDTRLEVTNEDIAAALDDLGEAAKKYGNRGGLL